MDNFPINTIDFVVIIIIVISAIISSLRGFLHEVLSIAAWIGAAFAVIYFQPLMKNLTRELIPNELFSDIITGIIIFIFVLVALSIIIKSFSSYIHKTTLNNLDRSLGFIFGVLRGVIILSIVLIVFDWFAEEPVRPYALQSSKTMPVIERTSEFILNLLPESFVKNQDNARTKENIKSTSQEMSKAKKESQQPESSSNKNKRPEGTYKEGVRRNMDRLFQNNQD